MITKRAFVLFHFGLAVALIIFGALALYALNLGPQNIATTATPSNSAVPMDEITDVGMLKDIAAACRTTSVAYSVAYERTFDVVWKLYISIVLLLAMSGLLALKLKSESDHAKP